MKQVRTQSAALRQASEIVGPVLAEAEATGAIWGLYVSAGGAKALFGQWMAAEAPPPFILDPPTRKSDIQRIHDHWQRRDGSPLGALDAACRIIEIYIHRPQALVA